MLLDGVALLASVLAMSCCGYLWLWFKNRLRHIEARYDERLKALDTTLRRTNLEFQAIHQAWSQVQKKVECLPEMSLPRPAMNLSRRELVLRMYRRGERPEQIAAALGLPHNEVDLLLKVHQLAGAG